MERKFCPGWVILSVQEICWKWLELKQDATKSVGLSSTNKGGSTNDSDPPTKFMRFEIIALVFTRLDLDHKQKHSAMAMAMAISSQSPGLLVKTPKLMYVNVC